MQNAKHIVLAQQRRVHLHHSVQVPLLKQVACDTLDLVWRASVHRGQGDAVDDARRDFDVGKLREFLPQAILDLGNRFRCVGKQIHKAGHARALDTVQVVADAHIEDGAERRVLPAEQPAKNMNRGPCVDILLDRFFQSQLLRPLHVITLIG
jgi:hypothetical protein